MDSGSPAGSVVDNEHKHSARSFMLRALAYRNYRLFFCGQGVSLVGTWLTTTATSWLVFRLAQGDPLVKAATVLGVVRFAGQIPMFLLAPWAGVLVDRWNRHHVLVAAQTLSMLQSAALAVLALAHVITIPQIILLNFIQGAVNAFDASARQAFIADIVERHEDLPNAIALNSSLFNGARLLGPALAGLLIWKVGEGMCFAIDAVSYLGVIIALLMMHVRPRARIAHQGVIRQLKEGLKYAFGFPPVRAILLLAGLISLTVSAYQTLMPIFAERLALSPETAARMFGFLGAAVGVGALAGAIYLASRRSVRGLGPLIAMASLATGIAMIGFALARGVPLSMVLAAVGGFGMIITFASSNTVLQTMVDDDMRGRLMSFFVMAIMGTAPIGSLIAGWVADRVGETATVVACGVLSILAAGLFIFKLRSLRAMIRPIYVRKGIIPEVASGLTTANLRDEE